jgi:hypothetical protein
LGEGVLIDEKYNGVSYTVDLLGQLDTRQSFTNSQILWEFSHWVLTKYPEIGTKVENFL